MILSVPVSFLSLNGLQRSGVSAVRDCGLQTCPPPQKIERGRMLELPLKPLLLLHFVMGRIILKV